MIKKIISIIIASCLILFVACGSDKPEAAPDIKAITDKVIAEADLPQMTNANEDMIMIMYNIDVSEYSDYSIYISADAVKADELSIIKVSSKDKVKDVKKIFETRVSDRTEVFKGYAPKEAEKLSKAVIKTKGNYVLLVVSDNPEKSVKIFEDSFNKQ